MTTLALYVRLEAKPGKEQDVENLLMEARSIVVEESGTTAWFVLRLGPSTFAIFDAFPDEKAREAHVKGKVAAKLVEKAPELFANQLDMIKVSVIADKLPGHG
jgi:quinol monooxygenase YgiN